MSCLYFQLNEETLKNNKSEFPKITAILIRAKVAIAMSMYHLHKLMIQSLNLKIENKINNTVNS